MLKQYREKRQTLTFEQINRLTSKDINDVFRPAKENQMMPEEMQVEETRVEVPTLFQKNKINDQFNNPHMIVR